MSKINELLNDKDSVLVFDIDGVLAHLEFGDYNHYNKDLLNDEDWINEIKKGKNFYTSDIVSKRMQMFLKNKDMSRVYVITAVGHENEGKQKMLFANKYYNIPLDNVYNVNEKLEKIEKLMIIKDKYPNLKDNQIIMIDDTVKILNNIMEKTNFSTAHISTFLDI